MVNSDNLNGKNLLVNPKMGLRKGRPYKLTVVHNH